MIIVTGIGGSGTSCVSGALHLMGVSMGKHFRMHPAGFPLYEDTCLYGAFGGTPSQMKRAIIQYAITHATDGHWGFKNTLAWKSFPWIVDLMRDLGYGTKVVVSHRTLMDSVKARKEGRCPPGRYYTEEEAIAWALEATAGMVAGIRQLECPVHHLSYEHLLHMPHVVLSALADFVGVRLTDEAVESIRR